MQRLFSNFVTGPGAVGLLILRLVAGGALMQHGWPKIQHAFHWMDKMPGAPPPILQALAAFSEFGGGLALILGLLTPIAAFGIACTMIVALAKVHLPHHDPWIALNQPNAPYQPSFEPALGYLSVALALMLMGPGILSLDSLIFNKNRRVPDDRLNRPRSGGWL